MPGCLYWVQSFIYLSSITNTAPKVSYQHRTQSQCQWKWNRQEERQTDRISSLWAKEVTSTSAWRHEGQKTQWDTEKRLSKWTQKTVPLERKHLSQKQKVLRTWSSLPEVPSSSCWQHPSNKFIYGESPKWGKFRESFIISNMKDKQNHCPY